MMRLAGKTAFITGGARGMGEACVRRFVSEGAKVLFTDLLKEEGQALANELGDAVLFAAADVTRESDWRCAIAGAEEVFGPVGILVNNAAIGLRCLLEEMSEEDYRKVVDVNQVSVFLGMKNIIPTMRRAGGGSIVNISSTSGLQGTVYGMAYCASKFAVRGMTKVAALELAADRIRVNSVHPGAMMTALFRGAAQTDESFQESVISKIPLRRVADPGEVADMVLFLASDEARYCTGAEFVVDGGMTEA